MNKVEKIINSDLCLGCGFCEAIATKEKCKMVINDKGFYEPLFEKKLSKDEINEILEVCPGINVNGDSFKTVWGNVLELSESWSTDSYIRRKASSGGVITALGVYLLSTNTVDGIIHVGVQAGNPLLNEMKISKSKDDVIKNCASRYAPTLIFEKIKETFDKSDETYAFIGKPCDIAGLKNYLKRHPEYQKKVKYFIALFCAGMPSYNGTKEILKKSGNETMPVNIKYRGDGWPGMFEARYDNQSTFLMSYNESWSKILSKFTNMRCKICPDGIGMLADISVGDSWHTEDGYPNFQEQDGRSFVIMRTEKGKKLFHDALEFGFLTSNKLNIEKLAHMQRYQYNRRLNVGFRLLPIQISTNFLLKFRGLGILNMTILANFKTGIINMIGTTVRLFKKR